VRAHRGERLAAQARFKQPAARWSAWALGIACCSALGARTTPSDAETRPSATVGVGSLVQAISALEAVGLTIFYSSSVVKPSMRVLEVPPAGAPREQLDAILAPLGLAARAGPRGSVIIMPAASAPPSPGPQPAKPPAPAHDVAPHAPPPIDEIVVAASRYEVSREIEASRTTLTAVQLEHLPDVGEDALRAVHRLPGEASNSLSAHTNVRGGAVDETLIRFDQLRLYDPYHLASFQGVFSAVDPEIVRSMDVYTGGFPVTFGDRMSGVIDVRSMSPPDVRHSEVALSFFNTSVLTSGLFRGGGEWVASARRSNLDVLYDTFTERRERPRYADGFAKVSYPVSDALRLTANVLYFHDDVALTDDVDVEEAASAKSTNRYSWLRLDHSVGSSVTGATLIARTRLSSYRDGVTAKEGISAGALTDRRSFEIDSLQSDWAWQVSDAVILAYGASVSRARGEYDYRDEVHFELLFDAPGAPGSPERERALAVAPRGHQVSTYAGMRISATPRLAADVGVRWDEQTLDPGRTATLDPRLGLRYQLTPATSLRLSFGRFHQSQGIDELQVADGVTQFFPPQRSDHWVLGLERELGRGVRLRAEAYSKEMTGLRPRFENLLNELTLLPELEPDRILVAADSGFARGFELTIGGTARSATTWWAAYSWSEANDRIGAKDVSRSWDQTHAFSGGVSSEFKNWNFSLGVLTRTGWPTTPVALDTSGPTPVVAAGERNSLRVGRYQSFDLRATRKFAVGRGSLSAFIEVSNALDHDNPCCTEYQLEQADSGDAFLDQSVLHYPAFVPSLGFVWSY